MTPLRIAVRADGDDRVGAGHVARCLPLARAFADLGHRPTLLGTHTGLAGELIARSGLTSRPSSADSPTGVLAASWDFAILDSYELQPTDICTLADELPIATMAEASRCDERGVLIDYHLDRIGESPTDRLLPGPRFAPIDRRFVEARRPRPEIRRVLITLGGSDAGASVLQPAIAAVKTVFPTASILTTSALKSICEGVVTPAQSSPLWALLDNVDLAVSAAGLSAYELACAGVPAVLLTLAANQRRVALACAAAGTAIALDPDDREIAGPLCAALRELCDPTRRSHLTACGIQLFDGRGAERAAQALLQMLETKQ